VCVENQHISSTLKFWAGQWSPEIAEIRTKLMGATGTDRFRFNPSVLCHTHHKKSPAGSGALYPDDAERADDVPKVFTRIHVHFVLAGAGLDPHKVERAIKLLANKYCSASMMLNKTAEMTHDFERCA
jgi:hypothetical protein